MSRRVAFALSAVALGMAGLSLVYRPAATAPALLRGPVVAIADGDTLTVLVESTTAGGRQVKVRLWGIDAPERHQPFGERAKQSLAGLVFAKRVTVEVRDTDRYGRSVGWVTVDGQPANLPVNLVLVQRGMAWWYQRFAPHAEELRKAHAAARAARLGLWADPAPIPPWDYRKAQRAGEAR